MKCLREPGVEVIFSNVLIDENRKPRWVGDGDAIPVKGENFQGEWTPAKTDVPMSHKNSRCTLLCEAIANHNTEMAESSEGAPVKVITYSGRDADTMPPIWVAKSADEGVVIGASLVSQATATEVGATGVRRQPWANAPFVAGSIGAYMDSQFKFFNNALFTKETRPILGGLNYFLTHENRGGSGKGLLGEKKDVHVWLGWLELYAHGDVEAIETPIGVLPKYEDLKKLFNDKIQKEYPVELYTMQFSLYIDNIVARIDLQTEEYQKDPDTPAKFFELYKAQKSALLALKEKEGAVVAPDKF